LAANLYAHSIFGEDALANVSIEKLQPDDDTCIVTGHIRIRAKSQGMFVTVTVFGYKCLFYLFTGMALSLGDKVNAAQKQTPTADGSQSRGKHNNAAAVDGEQAKVVNGNVMNGDV
jgi:coatomer subunit beta